MSGECHVPYFIMDTNNTLPNAQGLKLIHYEPCAFIVYPYINSACADCGGKLYVHRMNNGKRVPQFTCSQYSKVPVGTLCQTQHRINAEVVMTLIADMLRVIVEYSKNDRQSL